MLAADLFSGGGGLTNGLIEAGYKVVSAIEANPAAALTYATNHKETKLFSKDIRKIEPEEIAKRGELALLAACPPCQGFTSLTSKYKRDDPRNDLVTEVIRFARALRPHAVMLENVPRLATSENGRRKLDPVLKSFEDLGYKVSWHVLDAADHGVGQFRRRLVVYAAADYIECPKPESGNQVNLMKIIGRYTKPVKTYCPKTFKTNRRLSDWHVTRKPTAITLDRLRFAKAGGSRLDLPERLRPKCHQGNQKGFLNTYSRMCWSKPSPTITAGCLTMSKGRFGHPEELRTITLREAGRLQGFSDNFILPSNSIEENLKVIGNAFPAKLAAAAAKALPST